MTRLGLPIGRRRFMAHAARGVGAVSLSAFASSCRGASDTEERRRLHVDNWPAYIDATEDGHKGSVDRFRDATGIDVTYTEAVNDNNEYFAKIQPRLSAGRVIEPDIIVLSNWMAGRLIRLGWVDKLPLEHVSNKANLRDEHKQPNYDPTGEYSLPWGGVLIGIGYNRKATGRDLRSIDDLFAPDLEGRVGMLTEMRDTIGMMMLSVGIDPSAVTTFAQAAPAFERLARAKTSGQVRAFTGNDYVDDLMTGNFAACIAWQGDSLQMAKDNPDIRFIIPEQGGLMAVDTMLMPKGAPHRAAAAAWMHFAYDPVQAAQMTVANQSVSPVKGVQQELAKLDADMAANPFLFPDLPMIARLKVFANIDETVEREYDEAFAKIIGA